LKRNQTLSKITFNIIGFGFFCSVFDQASEFLALIARNEDEFFQTVNNSGDANDHLIRESKGRG
jgi:hypothetical protein